MGHRGTTLAPPPSKPKGVVSGEESTSGEGRKARNLDWIVKMEEGMFTNLPIEMVIDILSRLPIRSIITCKIVCKSWRELVESLEFANSHLCKSVPRLFVFLGQGRCIPYEMFEFVNEHRSARRCKIVSNLSLPHLGVILGSVNGLLFWCNGNLWSPLHDYIVCNPITREYMKLPPPPPPELTHYRVSAGVGVSKMGGQYKIVRILKLYNVNWEFVRCECQVHTVGSGSWRSLSAGTELKYSSASAGAFLNGNLHWLTYDNAWLVSCFDLETELFTSFSAPQELQGNFYQLLLSVVGDCLCMGDSISPDAIVIWLMHEYGDEKSWTRKSIIMKNNPGRLLHGSFFPIKLSINGDILIENEKSKEIYLYSKANDAIHHIGNLDDLNGSVSNSLVVHTPTFLPLRNLLMVTENIVSSFDV